MLPALGWLIVGGALLFGSASAVQAQTPTSCDTSFAQAQEEYYAAEFEAAIARLRPCAQERTLPDSVRARMYRLLSFVYLGQNDETAARQAVESLLDLQPEYAPDPGQDRPDFVTLVEAAKKRRRARAEADKDEDRRWVRWTLGAAAAALGTAAVLLLGGDDSGDGREPLPAPQPPPE
ncbi:hypothetical protein [Salinibacter altiplanensis]|uniref:hypothetical protein n=1 Tax=Salinibacter altiplanensis TaxID=1803181 RepID=UPI001F290612|nr:hypothetical protein [Salinibacter altiplanensis]